MAAPTASSTETLSAGTSTRADLIERSLRLVEDDPITDVETAGVNDTATSFAVTGADSTTYEVGDTLDFADDGTFEAAIVTAVASGTLTVRRGHRGTTAATHAANAIYRKNPRFLSHVVGQLVDEAVSRLWPDIFTIHAATYATATDLWYALPASAEETLEVYQRDGTPEDKTTNALRWTDPIYVDSGFSATKKAIKVESIDTSLTNFYLVYTAQAAVTELSTIAQDIVVYGTARRLLEIEAGHRATRQQDEFIFDATSKIQVFSREERRLRDIEGQRLSQYLPNRDRMRFVQRKHYTEGAVL